MIVVSFDPVIVFDRDAKPVEDLRSGGMELFQISIRESEIIGSRFFRVCIEIREHIRDIHVMCPAVCSGCIMQPAERDARFPESQRRGLQIHWAVVHAMQRFDFPFVRCVKSAETEHSFISFIPGSVSEAHRASVPWSLCLLLPRSGAAEAPCWRRGH